MTQLQAEVQKQSAGKRLRSAPASSAAPISSDTAATSATPVSSASSAQAPKRAVRRQSPAAAFASATTSLVVLALLYSLVRCMQQQVSLVHASGLVDTFLLVLALNTCGFIHGSVFKSERLYDLLGTGSFVAATVFTLARSQAASSSGSSGSGSGSHWHSRLATQQLLISALVGAWALRLGAHLVTRILRTGVDRRFTTAKENPAAYSTYWAGQVAWVTLVGLPVWLCNLQSGAQTDASASRGNPRMQTPIDALTVGLTLFALGFFIEAKADAEKAAFHRAKSAGTLPAGAHAWIDTGLWAISRHPNYLGEIMMWTGLSVLSANALVAPTTASVAACVASPILLALLLTRVSGIPLLERYADKTWGSDPAYIAYKTRTGVLLPLSLDRSVRFLYHAAWAAVAFAAAWGCGRMFPFVSHSLHVLPTEFNAWPWGVTQPREFDLLAPFGGSSSVSPAVSFIVDSIWNILLVAQFGFCHVGFARPAVYRLIGSRYHRAIFMVVTCISYHLLMMGWRHHPSVIAWDFLPLLQWILALIPGMPVPSHANLVAIAMPFLCVPLVLLCLSTVFKLDVFYFIGMKQCFMTPEEERKADEEYEREQEKRVQYYADQKATAASEATASNDVNGFAASAAAASPSPSPSPSPTSVREPTLGQKQLMVTGMYKYVRHPMYFWLQAVCFCTLHMTADRLIYALATTVLLWVGLPFEERKLVREFGNDYIEYQRRTPMLCPTFKSLCRSRRRKHATRSNAATTSSHDQRKKAQ